MLIVVLFGLVVLVIGLLILQNILFESRINRSLALVAKGQFQTALDILKNLRKAGKNLGALWGMAKAYHGLGQEDEAVKIMKKIPMTGIRGNKYFNTLEYYLFYADVSNAMQLYQDALKYLVYLKNNNFDFWSVNLKIAEVFHFMRDMRKSVHYLFLALEQNPRSWEAMLLLSKVYFEIRNYARALEFANRALSVNKSLTDARMLAGISQFKMDKYAQCIEMLAGLAPDTKKREEYLIALGTSFYKMNDYAKSYDLLGSLHSLHPKTHLLYKDVLYKLANSAEKIGRFKEAHDFWKDLFAIDPKYQDVQARYDLAILYVSHEGFKVYLFSDPSYFRPLITAFLQKLDCAVIKIVEHSRFIIEALSEKKMEDNTYSKVLFRFVRSLEAIDRKTIDLFHFEMKQKMCGRGFIYTVGPVASEVLHLTHIYSIEIVREKEFVDLLDAAYHDYRQDMATNKTV